MSEPMTAATPTPTQTTADPAAPAAAPAPSEPAPAAAPAAPAAAPTSAPAPTEPQATQPQSPAPAEPAPTAPEPGAATEPVEYVIPEGMPEDLKDFAKSHNLTQETLDATIRQFAGYYGGIEMAKQQAMREMGDAHVKAWGQEGQANLALAKQALKQNDADGSFAALLKQTGWGNHPAALNFLYSIGKSMQEGGYLKSAVRKPAGQKTAAQTMYPDLPSEEN